MRSSSPSPVPVNPEGALILAWSAAPRIEIVS
jgi:hypothetical protein